MFILRILLLCILVSRSICLYPVLLVPGDIASQMTAKYIQSPPHIICGEKNKPFTLWLNPFYVIPSKTILDCFVQTMKLNYSPTTRKTFPPSFCVVKIPGFGTVDTIRYLTPKKISLFSYFDNLINDLVKKFGYTANKNILGAPYDFRKAPNEIGQYIKNVISLIENMYASNGNRPVIIIGHSMGNLHMLRMFNEVSQQWKDKFVKLFISISAPYSGSMKAVLYMFRGFSPARPFVDPLALKHMLTTWPSTYYLLPFPSLWNKETIVATRHVNFTAQNIEELLKVSQVDNAMDHYEDVKSYMKQYPAPNVTTHCIYSRNVPTVTKLDYSSVEFPKGIPKLIYGDGDGTVNIDSLKLCGAMGNRQKSPVTEHVLLNLSHFLIVRNEKNLAIINDIISKTIFN